MYRRTFDFVQEPRGAFLRHLVQELRKYSSTASLVLRDELGLGEAGRAILARLEPRLLERKRRAPWPGTMLFDHDATVLRFRLDDILLEELMRASDGLYGWQQPDLPENLALLRDDGTAVLSSICHDQDAWLELSDREYESVVRSVPGLLDLLRPQADDAWEYFVG